MSMLMRFLTWLRTLSQTHPAPLNPDCLSPRDWADLPVHHPQCR